MYHRKAQKEEGAKEEEPEKGRGFFGRLRGQKKEEEEPGEELKKRRWRAKEEQEV